MISDYLNITKKKENDIIFSNDNPYKSKYNDMINYLCKKNIIKNIHKKKLLDIYKKKSFLLNLNEFTNIYDKIKKNTNDKFINDLDNILNKLFGDIFNIEKSIKDCITEIKLTNDQEIGLDNIINFLKSDELLFGLYGYAGSGKTTLISELLYSLFDMKYINKVSITAPTNKAVDVLKSNLRRNIEKLAKIEKTHESLYYYLEKLKKDNTIIDFSTIHKLLDYQTEINIHGEKVFVQGNEVKIKNYNLVIVDECSMIPLQIVYDLINQAYKNKTKIIFVGDPAQLPPVNEIFSSIFMNKTKNEIKSESIGEILQNNNYDEEGFYLDDEEENINEKINEEINKLKEKLTIMNTITLEEIVRSNNNNIINLSNDIRRWIMDNSKPLISKHQGDGVHIYVKNDKNIFDTKWLKKCIENMNENTNNIILTWTNKQSDKYNKIIRKIMFKKDKLDEYEEGDILMLNDYYNIMNDKDDNVKFYTSEQIRVVKVNKITKEILLFNIKLKKSAKKIFSGTDIENVYGKYIEQLNNKLTGKYICYELHIHKLNNISSNDIHILYVLESNNKIYIEEERTLISDNIKILRKKLNKKNKKNLIDEYIIKPLWIEFDKYYYEPFANVSYGYSITIHKSQGSTYKNVFIDLKDIMKNNKLNEKKRCIYTALTRASDTLHILT